MFLFIISVTASATYAAVSLGSNEYSLLFFTAFSAALPAMYAPAAAD